MWPFIKTGDFLTIAPVDPSVLKTGDIIFAKISHSRIIVHRLVAIHRDKKRVIMKGDTAAGGGEVIGFDQIYGRVTRIRGKRWAIDLIHSPGKYLRQLWRTTLPLWPLLFKTRRFVHLAASWLILKLTPFTLYRRIVKQKYSHKIEYSMASYAKDQSLESLQPLLADAIQDSAPGSLKYFSWQAHYRGSSVGTITLVKFPDPADLYPDWWIFAMSVRIPFRGAGVGRHLLRLAEEKTIDENGRCLYLTVDKNNIAARSLYAQAGFSPTILPQFTKILKDEVRRGYPERIILKKSLQP